jgi:uncharacterized protein
MDEIVIRDVLKHNNDNLTDFVESQRFIYKNIEQKVNHFLEKGGLNIILVTGLRGTGKTTILKTIAKKYNALYTSGDFLKVKSVDISDLTEISKSYDKKIIIIDEILYLSDWQLKLKIEADTNQKILYVISGSSAMQLKRISQDLSRRLDTYKLKPISFKEYLILKYNLKLDVNLKLKDFLVTDKKKLFIKLSEIKFKLPNNLFSLYKEYSQTQFPFLLEENNKQEKIYELIEKVIYKDMPLIDNMYSKYLKDAEIIIKFLSYAEKINYTNISNNLGIKKDLIIKIIDLLEKAELLYIVDDITSTRQLRSNRKILFSSPSLRFSLNNTTNNKIIGFSREDSFGLILKIVNTCFFYNYKQDGFDYLVNNHKFEVGNNKYNTSKDTTVIGDIIDLEYKKDVLSIPLYLFALIEQ